MNERASGGRFLSWALLDTTTHRIDAIESLSAIFSPHSRASVLCIFFLIRARAFCAFFFLFARGVWCISLNRHITP